MASGASTFSATVWLEATATAQMTIATAFGKSLW
jgi:hypothetical protein